MRRSLAVAACLSAVAAAPLAAASRTEPLRVLVKTSVPLTPAVQDALAAHATSVTHTWPAIDALALSVTEEQRAALELDPLVALVEPDGVGEALPIVMEAGLAASAAAGAAPIESWNIDMADVSGTGYDGSGVTVALVDSGLPQNWPMFLPPGSVDTTHAAGFAAEGWGDYHARVHAIEGNGGYIGQFPHGLAVSSVIVGFPSPIGTIQGAAPGVKILPLAVLNQFNVGWFSWFTEAFLYLAELKASGAISGPLVINFSIQAREGSEILTAAIDRAIAEGAIVVTIAGNFGPANNSLSFPGRLPQLITVGAVEWIGAFSGPEWYVGDVPENDPSQARVTEFSGRDFPFRGSLDVVAPGAWVLGEWLSGNGRSSAGYSEGRARGFGGVDSFIIGTSFAAPHVVGIVAQMLEKAPTLDQAQVEAILRGSALALPGWPEHAAGKGLARGAAALAATP
jgi:subtilisin family serine protease